jgi:hypothetical protein
LPLSKSFETTSGLLDEYEMTLSEVWFGKDPNYQEGKATLFIIRGEAELDGEVVDDEKQVFYSLGDGWEPDNDGDSAAHNAGKTQFNASSNMGKFIAAVVETGKDAIAELESRGTEAFEASTWQGLRFLFHRKRFTFKDRVTGEEREYHVELPVEFLGAEGSGGKKKAAAKPAAKSTARRTRKAPAKDDEGAEEAAPARRRRTTKPKVDAKLRAAVVEFAAEWEDHADFMNAVLDADEFDQADALQESENEELLNDILDESGSVWTESREL